MSNIVGYIDLTNCPDDVSVAVVPSDASVLEIDDDSMLDVSADQSIIVVRYVAVDRARSVKCKSTQTSPQAAQKPIRYVCPVCLEENGINPFVSTKCGHIFCLKCLEKHLKYTKTCPICRGSVGRNGYFPIYFNAQN